MICYILVLFQITGFHFIPVQWKPHIPRCGVFFCFLETSVIPVWPVVACLVFFRAQLEQQETLRLIIIPGHINSPPSETQSNKMFSQFHPCKTKYVSLMCIQRPPIWKESEKIKHKSEILRYKWRNFRTRKIGKGNKNDTCVQISLKSYQNAAARGKKESSLMPLTFLLYKNVTLQRSTGCRSDALWSGVKRGAHVSPSRRDGGKRSLGNNTYSRCSAVVLPAQALL